MQVFVCRAGVPTPSRRLYSREILQAQIDRLREFIDNRSFLGEIGPVSSVSVSIANVSHLVTDLWLDGDDLMAEIETLDLPKGRLLRTLLHADVPVHFSMVGVGSGRVDDRGVLVVGDSYKLTQIEAVEPVGPSDRLRSIDDPWEVSLQSRSDP